MMTVLKKALSLALLVVSCALAVGFIEVKEVHPVLKLAIELSKKESISAADISPMNAEALKSTDVKGRATPELQKALLEVEKILSAKFDKSASQSFQTLIATVGARMEGDIQVPQNNMPYWLKDRGPLDGFRSSPHVPKKADYVVIGAGLTGSSAALNLASEAEKGKEVVVLEMNDRPAAAASGRNGGNIEMIKENFLSDYRGFVEVQKDILKSRYPDLSAEELQHQAERQSTYLLKFFQANVEEIQKTVAEHKIQADVNMNGWLRVADSAEEEKGLRAEIEFAKKLGLDFEIWSAEKIQKQLGMPVKFAGRYIKQSGNYHPYKYVNEVMKAAIEKKVKFYTNTGVNRLERQADGTYFVHTNDGIIHTKKVILATNATTRDLFPEMTYIEPRVSHVLNFTHTTDRFDGMTVTMKLGDWYGNFPKQDRYETAEGERRGTLHVGGGLDTPIPYDQVHNPPFVDKIYHQIRIETGAMVQDTESRPPLRAWSGVMGFTADRAPILSFLYRNGQVDRSVIFAVAFNGYGGSQSAISGKMAAQMAITGETPAELPDDLFSQKRFQTNEPLFRPSSSCSGVFFR